MNRIRSMALAGLTAIVATGGAWADPPSAATMHRPAATGTAAPAPTAAQLAARAFYRFDVAVAGLALGT